MTTQGKGTFMMTGWDEKPYEEKRGTPKLTKATVTADYSGDIQGKGTAEYLMVYPAKDSATFVGLQRINGTVGGKKGTFVLQTTGTYEKGLAKADFSVVPGSGTGGLKGLSGKGSYQARSDGSADVKLNYNLS